MSTTLCGKLDCLQNYKVATQSANTCAWYGDPMENEYICHTVILKEKWFRVWKC